MEFLIVGITVFYTIILIVCICKSNKNFKTLTEKKIEDFNSETARKCEEIKKQKQQEVDIFSKELDNKIEKLTIQLEEKEKRYKEVNKDLEIYKQNRLQDIDNTTEEYKQKELIKIKQVLEQNKLNANSDFNNYVDGYMIEKGKLEAELKTIRNKLEEERSRRAAINEEILRRKKVEEQEEFYKIQLPKTDKPDIEILRATAPRLQHPEAINKIIWSNYYQKPLAELRKRLLPNGDYSGIYKLTRLKTGEIYIGQTTSIDKRFQDHVKSALGVGTLTSSQLHRTMAVDGPENFTFEILEKVPKDKLKEKESYYIDFYDSKNYGLNTVRGQEK